MMGMPAKSGGVPAGGPLYRLLLPFFDQWHSLVVDLSFNFPRTYRLTEPAEYAVGLKSRILVRGARFALHLLRNDLDHWRLGLVVPKRYAPRAIERNTIKRVWREAFRLRRAELQQADPVQSGCDLVVRLLPKKAVELAGVQKKKRKVPVKPQSLVPLRHEAQLETVLLFDQLRLRLDKILPSAATGSAPAGDSGPASRTAKE